MARVMYVDGADGGGVVRCDTPAVWRVVAVWAGLGMKRMLSSVP